MPCILNDNEIDEYLDHKASFASVYHLLKAFPAEKLDIYPVVPLINRLRNDGADCQMHADEHRKKRGIGAMVIFFFCLKMFFNFCNFYIFFFQVYKII